MVHVGASIGIALLREHGTTGEQLLQAADVAMYRVKSVGAGGSCLAAPAVRRATW